jgi:hypothetical protein
VMKQLLLLSEVSSLCMPKKENGSVKGDSVFPATSMETNDSHVATITDISQMLQEWEVPELQVEDDSVSRTANMAFIKQRLKTISE